MRKLVFSCLAGLALVGCGSVANNTFAGNPAQVPAQQTSVVVGRVELGGPVPRALVRLVGEDGSVYASATSDSTGMVYFKNVSVPGNFRAVTQLPGSTVELAAEIQGYHQKRRQARISLLTTLVSRYVHTHPGVSLAEAESRIRAAAKIPAGLDIESGPLDPNPFYSDFALLSAAGSSGGWEAFSGQFLTQAENNQGRLYRLSLDQLDRPIPGLEPGLSAVTNSSRLRMAERLQITQATGAALSLRYVPTISFISGPVSLGGQFLLGIGTGLGGNVVTAGVNGVIGWAANQMGLNYGTSGQLNQINAELQYLTGIVLGLAKKVNDSELKNTLEALDATYADVRTANNATLTQMNITTITDQPFSPPPSFQTLLGDIQAPNYPSILDTTNTTLVGPNQAIMTAQQIEVNQLRGLDRPDNMQNMPWRSNAILDKLDPLYGYFAGQQTMALNLLAEQAHNFYINQNPVTGVAALMPVLQSGVSSLKQQRQQLPLYTSQWGAIVDLENGIMWWEVTFAATDYDSAYNAAQQFSIPLVMPDGSVRTYDDWRLPTFGEMQSLQNRGMFSPTYDVNVTVSGNGSYPDVGHSTAGLPSLGFYQVGESLSGAPNDNGANGDLWMNYITWDGTELFELPKYEYRLNSTYTTSKESKSSDTNCYFICRTFGPEVLTNPVAEITKATSIPAPVPSDVAGQALTDGEIAQFGVPTALSLRTQAARTTVTYPDPDPTDPGGTRTLTVPSGAVQVVANITYQLVLGGSFTMGYNSTRSFSTTANSYSANVSTVDSQGNPNELSELVNWSSSNGNAVQMLNVPFVSGIAIPLSTTPVTFKGTLLGQAGATVSGTLGYTASAASPHTLQSIQISPRNQIYGTSQSQPASGAYPYVCTGHYADGTMETLAGQVSWSVPPNAANAQIVLNGNGASLEMNQPLQQTPVAYNVTITATFQGKTDSSTIQIVPGVAPL